jgi:hypothetical protein
VCAGGGGEETAKSIGKTISAYKIYSINQKGVRHLEDGDRIKRREILK